MQHSSRFSLARSRGLVLAILGAASAICYGGALERFPLLSIYARPIQNLDKLTNADGWVGLALLVGVVSLFVGYGAGAIALADARAEYAGRRTPWWFAVAVIGFPLIFLVLLALVYPTTSVDLYDYMFRGRMLVRYQANTFISTPSDFKSDPLFWYTAWRRAVTAYGPLWEGLSWLTARMAGEAPVVLRSGNVPGLHGGDPVREGDLLRLMLAYKGLSAVGFLFCGAAIWLTLRRNAPEYRWLGLYLWLWNPLALWESLAAGHNDAWMAALIVLAVGALAGSEDRGWRIEDGGWKKNSILHPPSSILKRSMLSFLALTAGGLIKFPALMFGPLLLTAALRRLANWRARLQLVLAGGLACAALVALSYAPFWVGWATLRNFSDRGTLFTNSWLAVLQAHLTLAEVKQLVPAKTLLALVVPAEESQPLAVGIGLGLLAFGVIWATWRSWCRPEAIARHALWLLLWFLFLCNPWFQPWYLLWALALLAIQPWRFGAARVVGVFCGTAMLSYLGGVFLLPLLGWDVDGAEWNALTSALIYLPPLLALLWGRRLALAQGWRWVRRSSSSVATEQRSI
jgi:hypothetical protein